MNSKKSKKPSPEPVELESNLVTLGLPSAFSRLENFVWWLGDRIPWPTRVSTFFGTGLVLCLLFFAGHYVMGDHTYRMAWAKTLWANGTHDISGLTDAKYSIYGIGHSLIHVPFIALSTTITKLTGFRCEGPVNMLLYTLNGALGLTLIFLFLLRYGVTARAASSRALALAVGTPWLAYSKVEYSESLVATSLLAMGFLLDASPFLAGLLGGYCFTLRPETLLWVPLTYWALSPQWDLKRVGRFAAGVAPGLILFLWSNYVRFGAPLKTGYSTQMEFITPLYVGLYGELFSSGKSIFLYAPVLILFPLLAYRAYSSLFERRTQAPLGRLFRWAATLLGAQLIVYGMWWDWSGDDAWGPRFLIPAIVVCAAYVAAQRNLNVRAFYALCALGLVVHLPALLLGPHTGLMMVHTKVPFRHNYQANSTLLDIEDLRFNPRYSPVSINFELLELKLVGAASPPARLDRDWTFLQSFAPSLTSESVNWDILWLSAGKAR